MYLSLSLSLALVEIVRSTGINWLHPAEWAVAAPVQYGISPLLV